MMGNRYLYIFLPVSNPFCPDCGITVRYHAFSDLNSFSPCKFSGFLIVTGLSFANFCDHLMFTGFPKFDRKASHHIYLSSNKAVTCCPTLVRQRPSHHI